jgi:hypothetical protein
VKRARKPVDPAIIATLKAHRTASGLPVERYAREVLMREPRTVRYWLAGRYPIPAAVARWLTENAPAISPG